MTCQEFRVFKNRDREAEGRVGSRPENHSLDSFAVYIYAGVRIRINLNAATKTCIK